MIRPDLSIQFFERVKTLSSPSELVVSSVAPEGEHDMIVFDMPFVISETSNDRRNALSQSVYRGPALTVLNSASDEDRQKFLLHDAHFCAEKVREMYDEKGAPVRALCEVLENGWDNELSVFLIYFRYWCEEEGTPI